MAAYDGVCVAVLLASMLLGAWRGLVYEIASVAGWVAAFILAQLFAASLAQQLPLESVAEPVRYALAFVLIFVAGAFCGGFVAALVRRLARAVGLRPVDRTLGAVFGVLRAVVLLLAVAVVVHLTAQHDSDWWQQSRAAGLSTQLLDNLKPWLPAEFKHYLP